MQPRQHWRWGQSPFPRRVAALLVQVFAGVIAAGGCGRASAPAPPAQAVVAAAPPVITALVPAEGPAGPDAPLDVEIVGTGFADEGNVVRFGPVSIPDLRSTDGGTRIRFPVPKELPGTGEAPPMVLPPGEYEVTVTTAAGTSNVMRFRLTGT